MHLPCIFDGHLTVLKIKARHVTGCPITVLCKELCANMCSFILLKPFSYIFMSFQFQAYHHFLIQTPPYNCVPTSSIWTWDGLHAKEQRGHKNQMWWREKYEGCDFLQNLFPVILPWLYGLQNRPIVFYLGSSMPKGDLKVKMKFPYTILHWSLYFERNILLCAFKGPLKCIFFF